MRYLSAAVLTAGIAIMSACSDNSGPPGGGGVLTSIIIRPGGNNQFALAGTALPQPVIVVPEDAQSQTVPGETATFAVTAGGGAITNTTGAVNSDGSITAPGWTLGKSAVTQTLQVTVGSVTTNINAIVTTNFKIDLRFFGRALTAAQTALFTNAAARIRAIVVGPLPLAGLTGADPAMFCGATGVAPLSGTSDALIIYASIDSIDGPRKILAQSGPCYTESQTDLRTVIGIMKFDSADINTIAGSGNLQEVITHEMIHVLGFGAVWDSTGKNLLINYGSNVSYIGTGGIAGCKALGAVNTCASSVPVEGTQGGAGTINSHWREVTFFNELMTGFINSGTNPLSIMTIRSLEDLTYTVNPAAADPYTLPTGVNLRAAFRADDITATPTPGEWERPMPHAPRALPSAGAAKHLGSN